MPLEIKNKLIQSNYLSYTCINIYVPNKHKSKFSVFKQIINKFGSIATKIIIIDDFLKQKINEKLINFFLYSSENEEK